MLLLSCLDTIFILCIFAFVFTALGLGGFLWRTHRQNKYLGNSGHGQGEFLLDM